MTEIGQLFESLDRAMRQLYAGYSVADLTLLRDFAIEADKVMLTEQRNFASAIDVASSPMYACLYASDPQLTASEVLRVFHRDEPYLFLGIAFITTGILAAAFALLRRKADPL